MELDEQTTAEMDALFASLEFAISTDDGRDGCGAKRHEIKRQIASVVSRGVKKRLKKDQQCG
jgi:hypothetical protein